MLLSAMMGAMTAPIRPLPLSSRSAAAEPVKGPVPAGVGAAPTRVESAPQPEGPGFFEKVVVGFKNLVLALFRYLFGLIKKTPPQQTEQAPAPVPSENPQREKAKVLLQQLREGLVPFDLLEQFEALIPEEERKKIYGQLGESVSLSPSENWTHWTQAGVQERHRELGSAMARKNLLLLVPYLISHLQKIVS